MLKGLLKHFYLGQKVNTHDTRSDFHPEKNTHTHTHAQKTLKAYVALQIVIF